MRAGVVVFMPEIGWISSSATRSDQVWMPAGEEVVEIVAACRASTHLAPCIAAADCPAMTPRRRDHSQAA
ncbi:hypothetical protein J113_24595 [Mycobacterium tuberculosis CAS/NITR204]|uniref:Uncharacterized protein n=1 Tax=Mycobacterium tuberculosis CAS/NITR204 TaxID=1310114 RepID=R4MBC3_MYCTX|nr:hypothetical protein J113_24595 [Mycobacterium tuberculosis CAS/NITR204]